MPEKTLREIASEAYYTGNPIMSDEAFDSLPEDGAVGYKPNEADAVPLPSRMYSLNKDTSGDLPDIGISETKIITPKLDGASCQILVSGRDAVAYTRGDGRKGKSISSGIVKNLLLRGIPEAELHTCIVTGEVVAFKDADNARNICAGLLNTKEVSQEVLAKIEEYDIRFVAYDVLPVDGSIPKGNYIHRLTKWPGTTVIDFEDISSCPTDGVVERLILDSEYYAAGFTDKFPRGAVAYKPLDNRYSTTLLDVIWDLGKSGKITPVAILEPVNIEGANVAKATLHNIGYLEELGAAIGDTVTVIRAGKIIPQVIGVENKPNSRTVVNLCNSCPSCGTTPERVNTGLFCRNTDCSAQNLKKVIGYCKALDIKGFGEKTLQAIGVECISDLYAIDEEVMLNAIGDKRTQKLLDELAQKAYNIPIEKFLKAHAIPLIGTAVASKLSSVSWDALQHITVAELKTYGLGEKASTNLINTLPAIQALDLPVVITNESKESKTKAPETNLTVCITGKLENYKNRKEAAAYLETLGVKVASSVTKNTNYLICEDGSTASSSYKKAESYGIPVVTINNLEDLI